MDVPPDCLWCGAMLASPTDPEPRCQECGRVHRRGDLRKYRTLRTWPLRCELALKVVAVLLVARGAYVGLGNVARLWNDSSLAAPVLGPIVGGVGLWYISGFITLRRGVRPPSRISIALYSIVLATALVVGLAAPDLPLPMRTVLIGAAVFGWAVLFLRSWRCARAGIRSRIRP